MDFKVFTEQIDNIAEKNQRAEDVARHHIEDNIVSIKTKMKLLYEEDIKDILISTLFKSCEYIKAKHCFSEDFGFVKDVSTQYRVHGQTTSGRKDVDLNLKRYTADDLKYLYLFYSSIVNFGFENNDDNKPFIDFIPYDYSDDSDDKRLYPRLHFKVTYYPNQDMLCFGDAYVDLAKDDKVELDDVDNYDTLLASLDNYISRSRERYEISYIVRALVGKQTDKMYQCLNVPPENDKVIYLFKNDFKEFCSHMNIPLDNELIDDMYFFHNSYDRLTIKVTEQNIYRFTPNSLFEKFSEYVTNEAHKDLPKYLDEKAFCNSYDYCTEPEVSYDFYIDNDDWYIRSLMNPAQNGAVVAPYTVTPYSVNTMDIRLRYYPDKDKIEIRVAPNSTKLVPKLTDNLIPDSNKKGWYTIKLDPIEENRIKEALKATQTYAECDADYKEECGEEYKDANMTM